MQLTAVKRATIVEDNSASSIARGAVLRLYIHVGVGHEFIGYERQRHRPGFLFRHCHLPAEHPLRDGARAHMRLQYHRRASLKHCDSHGLWLVMVGMGVGLLI